jgi:PST family polysaccharide transporter
MSQIVDPGEETLRLPVVPPQGHPAVDRTALTAVDDAPADTDSRAGDRPPPGKFRTAVLWSYVLTGGGFMVSGVVTFLMAAILRPHDYGVMALAMLWVTFAQMLQHHGPSLAIIQRDDVTDRHFDAAFWTNLGAATAFAILFAAVAPVWAAVNNMPSITMVCWALAPIIVLHALVVVPDAVLRRRMELRALSVRVLIGAVLSGAAGIAAGIAGWGVWALVVQQLSYNVLSVAMLWSTTAWRPRLRRIGPAVRDLRRFSLLSISEFLANFVATRSDAMLLGAFFGPVAVGLYRFTIRIVEMVGDLAAGGLQQVTLPDLARLNADRAAFAERLGKLLHAGALLAFPILGVLAAAAQPLLAFIGPEWVAGTRALQVLCMVGGVAVIGMILAPAVQAAGRPGVAAAIGWTEAACAAGALAAVGWSYADATPAAQVLAIAFAVVGVRTVFTLLTLFVMVRRILRVRLAPVLRPGLPALVAGVAGATVGTAVYALVGDGMAPFLALLVISLPALLTSGVVLLLLDAKVASLAGTLLRRFSRPRGRHAAA